MTIRIDRFLYQKEKPVWEKILLFPLTLLSLFYGGVVRTRLLLYKHHILKTKKLSCPVISVGNITVGGTGKTPLVMFLAQGLRKREIPVAVLSRGYKRKDRSESIVSDGYSLLLSPEAAGDEPYLMASQLKGVPVLAGADRWRIGQTALQQFKLRGILLDDGYQHLRLHRDCNILLIDSQTGFGDHHLLPRGILREPLSQLHRADLFLLTKVKHLNVCAPLKKFLQRICPETPIFYSGYEPTGLIDLRGEREALVQLRGKKVLAFSGIANPDSFFSLLKQLKADIVKRIIFPDHHTYTPREIASMTEQMKGIDYIVTTEKDMLKLIHFNIGHLPVRALCIAMKIREEKEFFQRVMKLFPKAEGRKA